MNYLKYTKFLYLAVAIVMFVDAGLKFNDGTDGFWLRLLLGGAALFTFFFRMKFAKKFENRSTNTSKPQ